MRVPEQVRSHLCGGGGLAELSAHEVAAQPFGHVFGRPVHCTHRQTHTDKGSQSFRVAGPGQVMAGQVPFFLMSCSTFLTLRSQVSLAASSVLKCSVISTLSQSFANSLTHTDRQTDRQTDRHRQSMSGAVGREPYPPLPLRDNTAFLLFYSILLYSILVSAGHRSRNDPRWSQWNRGAIRARVRVLYLISSLAR